MGSQAPTPWWVNEQLYSYVHKREAMPDVDRLQTLYIKHGGSDQQGLATVVASCWEPLGRNVSHGMPHRVSMRVAEAPAEFCMPVKQDRRLSPSFKVRMDVTLPQNASLPIFVKAQLITQQQKDNLTTTVPEEAAGGLGEDKNTKTFTELKGSTHQRHVFESSMGLSTLTSEQRVAHAVMQANTSAYSGGSPSAALGHLATLDLALNSNNSQAPAYSPFNMASLPPQHGGSQFSGSDHQLSGQMGPPPPHPSSAIPSGVQGWVAPSWPNQTRPSTDGSTAGAAGNPSSLDRMILDDSGGDSLMHSSHQQQHSEQPPHQPPAPVRHETPLTTISHDFEFVNLELLKPTRMNQVYMMFMCTLDIDVLMLLYHVPTIGICRAEQRLKACAKLGVPVHWLNGPDGAIPSAPSMGQSGMYGAGGMGGNHGSSGKLHKLDPSVLGGGGLSGAAGLYMIGERPGNIRDHNAAVAAEAAAGGGARAKRMACEQLMVPPGRDSMHMMDPSTGRMSLGVPVPPSDHHIDNLGHHQWLLPSPMAQAGVAAAALQGGHRQSNDGQGSMGVPSLTQLLGTGGGQQGRGGSNSMGLMRSGMTGGGSQNNLGGAGNSLGPLGRPSLNQYSMGNSTGLPGALPDGSLCVPGLKLLSGGSGNYAGQLSPAGGMGGNGGGGGFMGMGGNGGVNPFLTGMGSLHMGQQGGANSSGVGTNSSGNIQNSVSTPGAGGGATGGTSSGQLMQLAGRAHTGSHGVVTGEVGGNVGNSGALPRPSGDGSGRDGSSLLGAGGVGGTGNSGPLAMHSLSGGMGGAGNAMTHDGLVVLGDGTTHMGPPGLRPSRASSDHLSAGGMNNNGRSTPMGPPQRPLLNGGGSGGSAHFANLMGPPPSTNNGAGGGGFGGGSTLQRGGGSGGAAHFSALMGGGGSSGPMSSAAVGGSDSVGSGMMGAGGAGAARGGPQNQHRRSGAGMTALPGMSLLAEGDTLMPSSSTPGPSTQPLSWQAMRDWIQDEYEAAAFSRKLTGQDMQALLSQAGFPMDAATHLEHVLISEQQAREFQQQFLTTLQLLRQVANLWNLQDPCVVAGFDMDRNGTVQALAAQPPGTFICRFSMSQPGALVLSCKTQPSQSQGPSDGLLHAIIQIQDLYELRVDIWIRNFSGATHCLDVYRGKRVDKRKVFASDYSRIPPGGLVDTSSHQVPVPPEHQLLQQH